MYFMNKDKLPTAEEFLQEHPLISHYYDDEFNWEVVPAEQVQQAMIEFAKLHVKAALIAAANIANEWENSGELSPEILNAYPDENIK